MPPQPQQNQDNRQQGGMSFFQKMLIMWVGYQMFTKFMAPKPLMDTTTGKPLPPHQNMWRSGDHIDLRVYVSENHEFSEFDNQEALLWHQEGLTYDFSPTNNRKKSMNFTFPEYVKHNGSIWAHIYLSKQGFTPQDFDNTVTKHVQLNRYLLVKPPLKKKLFDSRKSLLGFIQKNDTVVDVSIPEAPPPEARILSFWVPMLHITTVVDFTVYPRDSIPSQISSGMTFDASNTNYYPILHVNDFWITREQLVLVNETTDSLPFELEYYSLGMWKYTIYTQMQDGWKKQEGMGQITENDQDDIKRMLTDSHPALLALTFSVSMLHLVFDFMAFKSDVAFWKDNKSLEGLSVRTIFLNAFCQLIIFLYLLDNETSWVVLISSGIGTALEFWKIGKAVNVKIDRSGRFPRLTFEDKASYSAKTKEFDELATKYLSYLLYPLVSGYSLYSLYTDEHKGFYSWIITSLSSAVYMFGFIMMTPQLFINYKLKSVAHLPWKQMTYKFLNTIVDDLFAFIIRMPWLHRLAVFRDDVIFLVYIYQRWIYPVDKTRINEFGIRGEDQPNPAGAVPAAGALPAPSASQSASKETPPKLEEPKKTK